MRTPEAMLSYPHLFEAYAGDAGQDPKFSCCLVFAPGTDLSELQAAAEAVAEDKFPGKGAAALKSGRLRSPFRTDAELKGYEEGSVFVNVRCTRKPVVVSRVKGADGKPRPITDAEEVYAGCIVKADIVPFFYDNSGNKGISFGLNGVQKWADGKRIGFTPPDFEADLDSLDEDDPFA